jgi:hypothetical protein
MSYCLNQQNNSWILVVWIIRIKLRILRFFILYIKIKNEKLFFVLLKRGKIFFLCQFCPIQIIAKRGQECQKKNMSVLHCFNWAKWVKNYNNSTIFWIYGKKNSLEARTRKYYFMAGQGEQVYKWIMNILYFFSHHP